MILGALVQIFLLNFCAFDYTLVFPALSVASAVRVPHSEVTVGWFSCDFPPWF